MFKKCLALMLFIAFAAPHSAVFSMNENQNNDENQSNQEQKVSFFQKVKTLPEYYKNRLVTQAKLAAPYAITGAKGLVSGIVGGATAYVALEVGKFVQNNFPSAYLPLAGFILGAGAYAGYYKISTENLEKIQTLNSKHQDELKRKTDEILKNNIDFNNAKETLRKDLQDKIDENFLTIDKHLETIEMLNKDILDSKNSFDNAQNELNLKITNHEKTIKKLNKDILDNKNVSEQAKKEHQDKITEHKETITKLKQEAITKANEAKNVLDELKKQLQDKINELKVVTEAKNRLSNDKNTLTIELNNEKEEHTRNLDELKRIVNKEKETYLYLTNKDEDILNTIQRVKVTNEMITNSEFVKTEVEKAKKSKDIHDEIQIFLPEDTKYSDETELNKEICTLLNKMDIKNETSQEHLEKLLAVCHSFWKSEKLEKFLIAQIIERVVTQDNTFETSSLINFQYLGKDDNDTKDMVTTALMKQLKTWALDKKFKTSSKSFNAMTKLLMEKEANCDEQRNLSKEITENKDNFIHLEFATTKLVLTNKNAQEISEKITALEIELKKKLKK